MNPFRRLFNHLIHTHFDNHEVKKTVSYDEKEIGVDLPIDIPENPFFESVEEREWRNEQNALKMKGLN